MKFWVRMGFVVAVFFVLAAILIVFNARTVGDLTIYPHESAISRIWLDARLRNVPETGFVIAPGSNGSGQAPVIIKSGDKEISRLMAANSGPVELWLAGNSDLIFESGSEVSEFHSADNGKGLLWQNVSGGPLYWTSRSLMITRFQADTRHIAAFVTDAPGTLTITSSAKPGKSVNCTAGPDGVCKVDLSVFDSEEWHLYPYSIAAALLFALTIFYLSAPGRLRRMAIVLKQQRVAAILFALAVSWLCWVFYPGIYQQDTIIHFANAKMYSIWYSSLYMLYNYIVLAIGLNSAIFLHLSIFLVGIYNIFYLCTKAKAPKWYAVAFVCAILLLPATILVLFGIQRYFTYGNLLFAGVTFAFRYFLARGGDQRGTAVWALFFLACAALMRPEWWLVFALCAALLALQSIRRKKKFDMLAIAVTLALTPVFVYVVDSAIPKHYNIDVAQEKDNYRFLAIAAMAYAYLPANGANAVSEQFQTVGYVNKPANFGAYMRTTIDVMLPRFSSLPDRTTRLESMVGVMKAQLLRDPKPAVVLLGEKLSDALFVRGFSPKITGGTWEINDIDSILEKMAFYQKTNGYVRIAMDFFRYPDRKGWENSAYLGTFDVYRAIERFTLPVLLVSFAVILLFIPLLPFSPYTALINLGIICLTLVISLFTPAPNYGYHIFLPFWAICALLFARLEYLRHVARLNSKRNKGRVGFSTQLAQ